MTRQIGLIGYPLSYSISPAFQQAALDHYSLPVRYLALPAPPEDLSTEVRRLRGEEYLGANVTIPHKERVMPLLDVIDSQAARVGAVNTVVKDRRGLVGHNTDGAGFVRSLREEADLDPRGGRFLLLGAGGAARGIASELAAQGACALIIANRTLSRAQTLAGWIRKSFDSVDVQAVPLRGGEAESAATMADAIIQCTSLGLIRRDGEAEGSSPLDPGCLRPGQVVVDIVYRPLETPFLRAAGDRGAKTVGGLGMLVFQGAENFRIWTGAELPVEKVRKVMEAVLLDKGGKG